MHTRFHEAVSHTSWVAFIRKRQVLKCYSFPGILWSGISKWNDCLVRNMMSMNLGMSEMCFVLGVQGPNKTRHTHKGGLKKYGLGLSLNLRRVKTVQHVFLWRMRGSSLLTEAACSPEGYTFCGWVLASCWRCSSLDGASWCLLSFDIHTWCIDTLWEKPMFSYGEMCRV